MKEKEKRLEDYTCGMKTKKELRKEAMKKLAQEKNEQIKEIEKKFLENKKEERMKIHKKNDELFIKTLPLFYFFFAKTEKKTKGNSGK